MTTVTTKNRAAKKRVIRSAAVSALCAGAFAGLTATPALAYSEWQVNGTVYSTGPEAEADVPNTEAKCRAQDGVVVSSVVVMAKNTVGETTAYASTTCRSKRG